MAQPLSNIPNGMRYYFGSEARQRRRVEAIAMSVFDGWSYEEINTPTLDYYSLFEHGMGAAANRAFRFADNDGRLLALRPDVTSAAARAAATLLKDRERPLRLCYAAPVFAQNPQSHAEWKRESRQVGCELIGANSRMADLEVLAIVSEVLRTLDLGDRCLVTLNDAGIFHGIAELLLLDQPARDRLRQLIDIRNSTDLQRFLRPFGSTTEARLFTELPALPGKRETLNFARQFIQNDKSRAGLERLEALWTVIESLGLTKSFEIDLADVSRLDYYTGVTFKIYVEGAGTRVGSGGRYDGLTESFGRGEPAVGFVMDLDALTEVARNTQVNLRKREVEIDSGEQHLADRVGTLREAMKNRSLGKRVMLDLMR